LPDLNKETTYLLTYLLNITACKQNPRL